MGEETERESHTFKQDVQRLLLQKKINNNNTDLPRGKTISRANGVVLVSGVAVTKPRCKSGVKGRKKLMIYETDVQFQHCVQPCSWGLRAHPTAAAFARHGTSDLQLQRGKKTIQSAAIFTKHCMFVDQSGKFSSQAC